tara:strand:- start:5168 stop:6940 length:1773 start_codon:yes stop_codon:yes gene_type:complete
MKISKLLNKSYKIFFLIFLIFSQNYLYSTEPTEPVDIWKTDSTDKNQNEVNILDGDENIDSGDSIYKSQSNENETEIIFEDQTLLSKEIKIVGLYDPEENDLSIDMWSNSDGKEILRIFNKIMSIELSNDSKNILNILFLTNSYFPDKNITKDEFIKIKSDWLIKNGNLDLIEKYLIKNYKISRNPYLIKFYINEYLSNSEVEKACEIFSKIESNFEDDYISKFNIYCLINQDKKDEAQLQFDLKKELGFKDIFFEEKFNILMGYSNNSEIKISEKSILDFHLSHLTTKDFKFEPNDKTKKKIWKYLSTSNLLENVENVDLDDFNKITTIEKATNEGNYSEKELFNLYKRFQFSINQLLTVKQSHKLLTNVESKALLYQGILITSEVEKKLELVKILKNSFLKEGMENVFNEELINILNDIDKDDVPPNFTAFYNQNLSQLDQERNKIKINNKIIHQSKLLNYFINNKEYKNIEKDLNNILNRAKKDKKYYVSTKDLILIESLKSDGFQIKKSLENFYNSENSNMPSDIQDLINNDDLSLVLLRLAEIIGQDDLENIGSETLYFIISALNQLNVDKIRNDILLKVLPLKV